MRRSVGPPLRGYLLIVLALGPIMVQMAVAIDGWTQAAAAVGIARLVDLGLITASALPHALIYSTLLALFAATLRPGREALITALARRMYGTISDATARYTRCVTVAWCAFFMAQLAASLLLFLAAPFAVWSLFVNVLSLPLVAVMFAAEQAGRPLFLRDPPHHSLADMRRMLGYVAEALSSKRVQADEG
jgi:uncharacterized membrane protein